MISCKDNSVEKNFSKGGQSKNRKCKAIGSFESSIQSLLEASQLNAKVTGYESEVNVDVKTFQLRPTNGDDKIKGKIIVLHATIENSFDAWNQSRSFVLGEDNDDNEKDFVLDDELISPQVVSSTRHPTFSDYANSGLDIQFCVAIDFTSSNGDPRLPGSLHYSKDGNLNDYKESCVAIGSTIEKYSQTLLFLVWGFGAKYGGRVRNIFQCGKSSTAKGTEGILEAYRCVFETDLIMSGPTSVQSVLKAAAGRAKKIYKSTDRGYCLLLILTDGIVYDLHATQELVKLYRDLHLPLSVILIGIGRADFSEFHRWNQVGVADRGSFTFVEYREHQYNPHKMTTSALHTIIPQEVVDYFVGRNIIPN